MKMARIAMQFVLLRNTCFTDRAVCCAIMLGTHQSQRQAIDLHKTKNEPVLEYQKEKKKGPMRE